MTASAPSGPDTGGAAGVPGWAARGPLLPDGDLTLQVQSVLYRTARGALERSLESLARATELAVLADGRQVRVSVRYGDASEARCLGADDVDVLADRFGSAFDLSYVWFGENLGSARGHNRLAEGCTASFLLTLNPEVVVSPRVIPLLMEPFGRSGTGLTEAKQLPIEHPKDYDVETGETSWASTACAMVPTELFADIGGFDAESFFMYCDDVDFSWSVRRRGLTVVHQPAAVVFHDKRLGAGAAWQPSAAERYYSAEAALLLLHKWSRPDLLRRALHDFDDAPLDDYRRAATEFRRRELAGELVPQVDPEHRVGVFVDGYYAAHRFVL